MDEKGTRQNKDVWYDRYECMCQLKEINNHFRTLHTLLINGRGELWLWVARAHFMVVPAAVPPRLLLRTLFVLQSTFISGSTSNMSHLDFDNYYFERVATNKL